MSTKIKTPPDRLEALLKDYLHKKTNYAIMLTASWGAGKTYYLKHTFFKNLKGTYYHGIMVSLFGVKTIDDIKDKIFIELYPFFDNKFAKASGSIAKALLKSIDITQLAGKGLVSSAVDNVSRSAVEIAKYKLDFTKLEKLLICFDDLERVNPDMLVNNQILGFINSLVEDNNVKVIIVANEGKIEEKAYKEIKEKTIGNTIYFQQDFSETFENIINNAENPTAPYLDHLRNNKPLIKEFLLKENQEHINYRTLSYFLSYYDLIFHYINSGFKIVELDILKNQILLSVLKFSLMICVEYKKGKIAYQDKQGLNDGAEYIIRKLYSTKENQPKNYGEVLIDTYFNNEEYEYFESIYNYLTGGDFFDKNKLFREICKNYHVENQSISDAYKAFNKLSSLKYRELSDAEYVVTVRQLKNYALNGEYSLHNYLTIFYYIQRHGNVLNIDPQSLVNQLLKVIKKIKNNHVYSPMFEHHVQVEKDNPFYKYYSQLAPAMIATNQESYMLQVKNSDISIEKRLESDYISLHQQMIEDIQKPFTRVTLSGIKPANFLRIFKKANNEKRSKILVLIHIIYSTNNGNTTKLGFDFFAGLEEAIAKSIKNSKSKNISGNLLSELQNEVKKKREALAYLNQ